MLKVGSPWRRLRYMVPGSWCRMAQVPWNVVCTLISSSRGWRASLLVRNKDGRERVYNPQYNEKNTLQSAQHKVDKLLVKQGYYLL